MFQKYGLLLFILLNVPNHYCQDDQIVQKSFPSSIPEIHYLKKNNAYEIIFEKESSGTISQGYVELVDSLMQECKAGRINTFNKFNTGFDQYFKFKLYEMDAANLLAEISMNTPNTSVLSPISLPGYSDETMEFRNISIFGFPRFLRNVQVSYDGMNSATEFKVQTVSDSDIVIFTGSVVIDEFAYFLTYNLKENRYSWEGRWNRGIIEPWYAKSRWQFAAEELLHTYDSVYDNYAKVNDQIQQKFIELMATVYHDELKKLYVNKFKATNIRNDLQFVESYKKQLQTKIIESAIQYVCAKDLNTFEITPINFTSSTGPRKYVMIYKNIKLEGLLNYEKYEIINSTSEVMEDEQISLSEVFRITFPENDEKETRITFVIGDGWKNNFKKFKVKGITITVTYSSSLSERPFQVVRNKEKFLNNSGFLIKFELEEFDPIYGFLIKHIGNDMARAIEETLLAEGA